MNKQVEAGMFVVFAVLMVMSAAGIYHSSELKNEGSVDHYIQTQWHHLTHWLTIRTEDKSAPLEKSTAPLHDSASQENKMPASTPQGTSVHSPSSDEVDTYKRLTQIGVEFVDSMSQKDWQKLTQGLTQNSQTANQVVNDMIAQHVSTSDRDWIKSRFQGKQSFDAQDVALLQQSIQEFESELTPQEMGLLHQAYPAIQLTKP